MTLSDTGPLVSLFNLKDADRDLCLATLPTLSAPLVATWICIAEAMYLLRKFGGLPAQERLWQFLDSGGLSIHVNTQTEQQRMRVLMRKYSDLPMDLADASLVAAAETLREKRIFTLDGDFRIYRLHDRHPFEIVP